MDDVIVKRKEASLCKTPIQSAIQYALNIQHPAGYWFGILDSNSTMEAEFIFLLHFLGIEDEEKKQKAVQHILKQQREDGSWSLYYNGPADLSTTVECYFALKLAGISADAPFMQKAKAFILVKGGVPNVRIFTKIWLALFGQWQWSNIPIFPPEIIFLPTWFPINIYAFASWTRATILPLTIVMTKKPVCSIPDYASLKDVFPANSNYKKSWIKSVSSFWGLRGFFWIIDKLLHAYEHLPWKIGRERAYSKVLKWILDHQEVDGSWAGIQPPWVYSLIALKSIGFDITHPVMQKGMQGFKHFSVETTDTLQIQACISPVWDTGLMVIALQDAGVESSHPALQKAVQWLIKEQIFDNGDWQVKEPNLLPGGWAFEFKNRYYPDIDDTAEVVMALHRSQLSKIEDIHCKNAISRGTEWLLGMQSRNGGWAAFDKDNDSAFLTKLPFFDFGEILDPPSADVTAHVLEALGRLGHQNYHPDIRKALQYLYNEQEPDGSWFGRWGVNYIYGIGAVLPALEAIGEDMQQPRVRHAINWLIEHQNPDGGWGECCSSYADITKHGKGVSTASQTAWALLALMAAGDWEQPSLHRGIDYLNHTINAEGTWDEPQFTGCGFPGYGEGRRIKQSRDAGKTNKIKALTAGFMINYRLYRHCWPLMALGRFQRHLKNKSKSTDNE